MKEEWKIIQGSDNRFKVSNTGKVWNIEKDEHAKININKFGYLTCSVKYLGKSKSVSIHRLVAIHFIPNTESKPTVNHKDADKSNNQINNLEWATYKEQMEHVSKYRLNPRVRYCCEVDNNGNILKIFDGVNIAAKFYEVNSNDASSSCVGYCDKAKHVKLRHYDEVTKAFIPTRFDLDNPPSTKGRYNRKIISTVTGKIYNSQMECSTDLGISQVKISKILRGNILENPMQIMYKEQ